MLKHHDLTPDEQSAAFRLADELQRRDTEESQNARSHAAAAEELGVSQEYLDRAAEIVYAERVEKIKAIRRRRTVAAALGAGVLGIGLIAAMTLRPSPVPAPPTVAGAPVTPFTVPLAETESSTTAYRGGITRATSDASQYRLAIDRFQTDGNYQANAGFQIGRRLAGYRQFSASVQGDGIAKVRIDLRNGNERWNSPEISVSPSGRPTTIRFDQLRRQVKEGDRWVDVPGAPPDNAQQIVFKFGRGVNGPDVHGTVTIRDVRFE